MAVARLYLLRNLRRLPSKISNFKNKNDLGKIVRIPSFQKTQSQSVSVFFKFVRSIRFPFVFAIFFIPSYRLLSSYFRV